MKSCNWIALIGHLRNHASIMQEIGTWMTNHNQEFCD